MRALLFALLLAIPVAQVRPPQVRDNTPAPIGTATIAGRVVSDDASGQPLRRVSVTLSSGGLRTPQITMSDDAGRFRFGNLAGGTYTIGATRLGYVSAYYGSKKAGKGPGIPIAVLDGQQVANINVRMLRGGAITGTIRFQSGRPAQGVNVLVQQVSMVDGRRRMSSSVAALMAIASGPSATDDRGVYRVFGLPPGDYVVQVSSQGLGASSQELRQVTAAEIQWAQQAAAQGSTASSASPTAPSPGRMVTYAPVFYPGTTIAADAGLIALGAGEERSGVDFTTQLVPTAKITGTVFDPDGHPLSGAQVSLKSPEDSADVGVALLQGLMGESSTRTGADGTFTMNGVRPGRYALTTRGAPARPAARPGAPGSLDMFGGDRPGDLAAAMAGIFGSGQPWWASDEVAVDGRDLSDVTVRLQTGMTLSGHIVFEGSAAPPADLTKTRVTFSAMPTSTSPIEMAASMMTGLTIATTAADGTFVAKGVTPGKYRATMGGPMVFAGLFGSGPNGPWTLKSVMLNGRDIADVALDVRPNQDVTGIVVTMTDRATELSGAVIDQAGRPTGSFPIVVFSTDRTYWTVGSRRVQQARPASDGKFKVSALPAGEYYVCAVTDLDPEDLYNPAFLEQLAAAAYKVKLADGQKLVQDLQLR